MSVTMYSVVLRLAFTLFFAESCRRCLVQNKPGLGIGIILFKSMLEATMSDPDGSMGRLASVQDELESMVECPVHFGVLVQPKSLPCGHVICLDCIRRWVEARRGILVCPECNNEQILPRGGVEELPNSYRLMKLCEYLGNLNIVASALEGDAQANTAAPPVMRCDDH
ncbi:putative RING finger protein nhl-1-like [Apostichopus japonicus]|uniref:Putative RING finger protein nhl-1-like n=1 Tax=Stichopus japonicus TaxID=307972 RepID=A0A2G8LEE5_STIJA|nr:putative RING finger protein nhl-1-like [Apostichopus japonicus]